jgi:hypothetical protein
MLTSTLPRSARKHHWWRWIAAGVAALVVVIVAAVGAYIQLQPTPAPLSLPSGPVSAPAGPLDGTWLVGPGSAAGFRVRETALGFSNDAVGRTAGVTGSIVIAADRVTSATLHVQLTTIKVGGRTQPQFAASLDTAAHPVASFSLTEPTALTAEFASGSVFSERVIGQLSMNGATRAVAVSLSARRDGSELQVAGFIPVTFAAWRIAQPTGFGFLGSLASHGIAEFLLVLHRQ